MAQNGLQTRTKARGIMKPPSSTNLRGLEPASTRPNRPTAADVHTETRSASAASTSTAVSVQDQQTVSVPPRSPLKRAKEHGSNIKVVVRCRGASKQEIRDGTPVVVATDGPRSEEIVVTTGHQSDTNALNAKRTYQFDQVFGSDADQSIIYQDVVVPILNEVFDGYNATLCAYGQTGTGKTYTMHGQLDRQTSGALSADAGIVPRVVTRLFQRLEKDYTDFAVGISYMELYNEELRDLLAPQNAVSPLKVFEEPSKKGTVVQGLLEIQAKDVKSAINILRIGNERRQIAATKLNDHSSRSHSIFTISVTSVSGSKDMFQIGKLNLVDLAGSEDIGRSGAENMRAKEAGLINRSLLTLGRVINALVDRMETKNANIHVPYRESILTRVLQDSLGGHTKTCIIATVSPVKANLEETISTLDYATRARSIKNNPEATRRVAKHTLLKEMVAEMAKIRADLTATREKNGRYFDEDRWAEMEAEQELLTREHAESRRAREIKEAQLLTLREEYEYNMLLLTRKDGELSEARDALVRTASTLSERERELENVRRDFDEETAARLVFEKNEATLDRVATGLSTVARQGISDLDGLFHKLDRKEQVLKSNNTQVKQYEQDISKSIQSLSVLVEEHRRQQRSLVEDVSAEASSFLRSQSEVFAKSSTSLEEHVDALSGGADRILAKEDASAELSVALARMISDTSSSLRASFDSWKTTLLQNEERLLAKLRDSWETQTSEAAKTVQTLASVLEALNRDVKEYAEKERKALLSINTLMDTALGSEIARLQQQNEELTKLARTEKAAAETMRNEVIQHVTKIMHKYSDTRDNNLRDATTRLSSQAVDGQQELEKLKKTHGGTMNTLLTDHKELLGRTETRAKDGRRAREGMSRALDALGSNLDSAVQQIQDHTTSATSQHQKILERDTGALDAATSGAFERLDKGRISRVDELKVMRSETQETQEAMQTQFSSAAESLNTTMGTLLVTAGALRDAATAFGGTSSGQFSILRDTTRSLTRRAAVDDAPTGTTPQKRKWVYEDEWEVVKDRATAIKRWREEQAAPLGSHIPAGRRDSPTPDFDTPTEPAYIEYNVPLAGEDDIESEEDKVIPEVVPLSPPTPDPPVLSEAPVSASIAPQKISSRSAVSAEPRRRATATQSSIPETRKVSGIARGTKRVVSGNGSAGGSQGVSRGLVERSNATGRKRDKA